MNIKSLAVSLALGLAFAAPLITAPSPALAHGDKPHAPAELTAAEVKKIDKENGKVTLKHEEIKSLEMPGMTMVFRVKEEKFWPLLTEGAKIKFSVEKTMFSGYVLTHVETQK